MSLWADYAEERLGWKTIELEGGFITYELKPPHCSIEEFYVSPEKRGTRLAKTLADLVVRIAEDNQCLKLWASVTPGLKGAEHALRSNLHYGFKLSHLDSGRIILVKDIDQGG